MEHFVVLDPFLKISEVLQNLDPKLVAKVIPLLLEAPEFLNVRKVLLLIRVGSLTSLDLNPIGLVLHLRIAAWLEEEAKERSGLPDEISSLFVLLVYAKVSLLFNSNDQLVQVCQCLDRVLHILLGGVQLADLLAAALDDCLGLTCVCFHALDLVDHDYSLFIDSSQLVSSCLLSIGLISNACFYFRIQFNELLIIFLNLAINIIQLFFIFILLIKIINNIEVSREQRIIFEILKPIKNMEQPRFHHTIR